MLFTVPKEVFQNDRLAVVKRLGRLLLRLFLVSRVLEFHSAPQRRTLREDMKEASIFGLPSDLAFLHMTEKALPKQRLATVMGACGSHALCGSDEIP